VKIKKGLYKKQNTNISKTLYTKTPTYGYFIVGVFRKIPIIINSLNINNTQRWLKSRKHGLKLHSTQKQSKEL